MIPAILNAMKLSLSQCDQTAHPAVYIHELNQVLNRYKTNIFKLVPDKEKMLYDPKELMNFKLYTSWRTRPGPGRIPMIMDRTAVMLQANGFIPQPGQRRNLEKIKMFAIDISDVINVEKIASLKTDYYEGMTRQTNTAYVSEDNLLEQELGAEFANQCSVYFSPEKAVDDVINFCFQLNSFVYSSVLDQHHLDSAQSMAGDYQKTPRQLKLEAKREAAVAHIPKKATEPTSFFSDEKRVSVTRSKNLGGKQEAGSIPRKRHDFW